LTTTPAARAVGRPACCGVTATTTSPAWAGKDLTTRNPTVQLAQLASDGATFATVAGEQLRQLDWLELIPTLATVTMGGNDLLAASGNSTAGRQAIRRVTDNGQRLLASLRP
jgi:lysophospholipase L1-like esterase